MLADKSTQVIAATASFIRFMDNGARQDDQVDMALVGSGGETLGPDGNAVAVLIPTESGAYDVWVGWEAGNLKDAGGATRPLDRIELFCSDGGGDGVCTVRLIGEVLRSDGTLTQFDAQRTVAENETEVLR